jgi:uncharacterized protein (DUF302 family)
MTYYMSKKSKLSFEKTLEKVKEELKKEGFGVLTEIDIRETMKKKLDVDFRNYRILGACNPPFAYQALQKENKIGTLLPCNVIVQDTSPSEVEVSAINPMISMNSVKNPDLMEIARKVQEKLKKVISRI